MRLSGFANRQEFAPIPNTRPGRKTESVSIIREQAMKRKATARNRWRGWLRSGILPSALLCCLLPGVPAGAVIVRGPQGRNRTPPTGELAVSGWRYEGLWGIFSGTAIGPHHFITAKHVGGWVGQTFLYQGKKYESMAVTRFPDCDLAVWTVAETFPEYATLYTGTAEVEKPIAVFGRGTTRGLPVYTGGRLRGWRWGPNDGALTWGTNRIIGTLPSGLQGSLEAGEKIVFDFSEDGGTNEGSVSSGDSGGGVFLYDGGDWKLAGVNYGVSGHYSLTGDDSSAFEGAIFDGRGLWRASGMGYAFTGELEPYDASTLSFATRLSTYAPRIQEIVAQPVHRDWLTRRNILFIVGPLFLCALAAYIHRARHRLRSLLRGKREE